MLSNVPWHFAQWAALTLAKLIPPIMHVDILITIIIIITIALLAL